MKILKTKKILLIAVLLSTGLVAGCSRTPTPEEYEQANQWCESFGGMESKTFSDGKGLRVRCIDGHLIVKYFSN